MAASSLKIEGLLGMVTLRLKDDNFLKWRYQIESVLEEVTAAYKEWLRADKALLSFLIATLSDDAIEYVIGSKTARDAWLSLSDHYATVSRALISHLKTELQTAQKGGDSIDKFLLCLKRIKDQLSVAGISISDDDLMIAALNGLPSEYDMIKTVLIARDTSISFKDFRTQLLAAEQSAESRLSALHTPMVAMIGHTSSGSLNTGAGILPTPSTVLVSPSGFHANARPSGSMSTSFGRGRFSGNRSFPPRGDFQGYRPSHGGGFQGFRPSPGGFPKFGVVPECQICNKRGHTAVNCYHRNVSPQHSAS
ncbi:uncharacterized protein LOC110763302 [Prunus avium]|uniref:Uncharacterized protein LOC110763302 n=1 Tax=Prunus avium TaxID=42229 RepID=A0A6P5SZD0_PRUAV|nr:uncharacterized protein LOC110763302 [Prunus avium]